MYFFVSIVLFYVLFVCKCVLVYCHRVATQLRLNISYHITDFRSSEAFPVSKRRSVIHKRRLRVFLACWYLYSDCRDSSIEWSITRWTVVEPQINCVAVWFTQPSACLRVPCVCCGLLCSILWSGGVSFSF
jgi:hypothetical protein